MYDVERVEKRSAAFARQTMVAQRRAAANNDRCGVSCSRKYYVVHSWLAKFKIGLEVLRTFLFLFCRAIGIP